MVTDPVCGKRINRGKAHIVVEHEGVAYDLAFGQRMYESWRNLLPGFTWLTWPSFFLGLVETFLYGVYTGLVFVPLYNVFASVLALKQRAR